MKQYLIVYAKVGLLIGSTIFVGNMISICIPNNNYVAPYYMYNTTKGFDYNKLSDCIIISLSKSIIGGITWPTLILNTLFRSKTLLAPLCLGHVYSPVHVGNKIPIAN